VNELTSRPPLAGILTRFGAVLLDGLVPNLIVLPLAVGGYLVYLGSIASGGGETMITLGVFIALLAAIGLQSYTALILAMWAYGLTPGKWMLGIRVVNRDSGLPVGFWRMALRQIIGQWVAAIICYLGFIWALFDANRQGWHDKIAKTLVVRAR
jgi:uncharacterized RDD family membrane protein YckC